MIVRSSTASGESSTRLLGSVRLPARLTAEQVGVVLGFAPHDIPVLVNAKLLDPLGKPAQSAVKYFAAVHVEQHASDPNWLAKATNAIYGKWARENQRRRGAKAASALATPEAGD